MAVNMRKVAIVGCGRSGSAVSFSLMQSGLFSEMVLVDSLANKAERVAHDLAYGISFVKPMNIYAGGYDDLADAGIIVMTAGEPRLSTDSRMEFIRKNVNVLENIIPKIAAKNTEAIFLIVTNPVDILTYAALKYIEIPESRIIGIGTILDTARVKYLVGKKLFVREHVRRINALDVRHAGRCPRRDHELVEIRPLHEYVWGDGRVCADHNAKRGKFGFKLIELAKLLQEEGCVEAFNLDGGISTALFFLGVKLNHHGDEAGTGGVVDYQQRPLPEGLAWGYSELCGTVGAGE